MSRFRRYAQLVRLPNLPSAMADICMAALVLAAQPAIGRLEAGFPWLEFALLLFSSSCLYMAGMVWNDFFDQEQDKKERPHRPIVSGRVSPREAIVLGTALMVAGWAASLVVGQPSWLVAGALVVAIFAYDRWLKRSWAGPVGMGLCRFLNVLLGLSLAGTLTFPWGMHLAGVVGLYIVGVTWFARTEASITQRTALQGAAGVLLLALVLALPLPVRAERTNASPLFPYLLVALGFLLGIPVAKAIRRPTPAHVQSAVRRCLLGLILLDATLACALAGSLGLLVLLLLIPGLVLNWQRWLYAT